MIQENPDVPYPSTLVEGVLGLLEDAGVPTEINDRIVEQIEAWERGQEVCEHAVPVGDWCQRCNEAYHLAQIDPENGNGD